MKRDDFENALSRKMDDYRCNPPEGMFARIESSLPAAKQSKPSGNTRPLGRVWRYAAVAAILAAIVWPTLHLTLNRDAEKSDIAVADVISRIVATPEESHQPAGDIAAIEVLPQTLAAGTVNAALLENRSDIAQKIREAILPSGGVRQGGVEQLPVTDITTERIALEQFASSGEDTDIPTRASSLTSGKSADDGQDFRFLNMLAADEERASKSRRNRISASLYAGNLGIGMGDNLNGVNSLLSNGLYANEIFNSSTGSTLVSSIRRTAGASYDASLKHRMPLSAGLRIGIPLSRRLSLETGVNYSFLHSISNQSQMYSNYSLNQRLHYIGIPLGLRYNIYDSPRMKIYLAAGGMVEKGIYGRLTERIDDMKTSEKIDIKGIQPSVDASVGAMFMLNGSMGLYAEPGVAYYFENVNQPASYRTENPANVTVKFGLRFLFGK